MAPLDLYIGHGAPPTGSPGGLDVTTITQWINHDHQFFRDSRLGPVSWTVLLLVPRGVHHLVLLVSTCGYAALNRR